MNSPYAENHTISLQRVDIYRSRQTCRLYEKLYLEKIDVGAIQKLRKFYEH